MKWKSNIVKASDNRYPVLLLSCVLLPMHISAAEKEVSASAPEVVEFNEQFLFNAGNGRQINVDRFTKGNPVLPGIYNINVYINDRQEYNGEILFKDNGSEIATPCITHKLLMQLKLENNEKTETSVDPADETACYDPATLFPGAQLRFDSAEQRLDITLPQIYASRMPRDYIDPSLWDSGINAAMFSWDINAYSAKSNGDTAQSLYAGLNSGFNLGAWRFRSRGAAHWSNEESGDYDHQELFVQRDIPVIKSQWVVGDTYTSGDTFDSISLRGMRLYSDDRMKPASTTGYAPVVRGVANSNAKVTIRQNDNIIYENTVPPGPFAITDLNPTGYGTDLDVTVEESDGSRTHFSVPFSSVTQLLRPGDARWEFGIGQLNEDSSGGDTRVITATGYYGLNNIFTGYSGFEFTDTDYYAGLAGIAMNTSVGAFAFDVTHSHAEFDSEGTFAGQSYRLTYSKLLELTETSLNVAAYRFSTQNYYSLRDAAQLQETIREPDNDNNESPMQSFEHEKNEIQININQPLRINEEEYGSVYLTGSWQNYWNSSKTTSQYSLGYSHSLGWASYNISVQRAYNEWGEEDDRAYVSVSLPLDRLLGHERSQGGFNTLNTSASTDFKGNNQTDMSISGNSADNRYSYSVNTSLSQSDTDDLQQIGGYATYNSPWGPFSGSVSVNNDNGQQYSLGNSGGVVLHSGGLTLTPGNLGVNSTIALVQAKGAKGTKMSNGEGQIDNNGYAVIPWLSPYHENNIGLNIDTLENDIEIENTSSTAIPRDGAVILVNFATDEGQSVLLELNRSDKGFIPLGADVYDHKNNLVGSVGQAGRAWVRGINQSGTLSVRWGRAANEQCEVNYQIPSQPQTIAKSILLQNQQCYINH
jgi:outer membrane usher protein